MPVFEKIYSNNALCSHSSFPLIFRYDIVFTSTAYGCLFLKALFGIKKFKWIILDFNILGAIQEGKTLKQKFFTWSITRGADGIVAISQAEADALKKRFPKFIDKIIFLHEPTDTNFFSQKSYMAEKNQIISVGNYARDFDTIIEAVRGLGVELILATKLISPQKAQLLPAYVKVAHLNHQDIVRAYNESKMAIVSLKTKDSYYDSVGTLSLGESMSMGKATIVTHTKNMESYIEDGINGVFIGRENITEMRKAICYLLNNDNKRNSIGIKAREFALNNLDPELFAEKLAFFLKNVVQLPT